MGRRSIAGVEQREKSIRIYFNLGGKQRKETLYIDDQLLSPTAANIKYARTVAKEIHEKIKAGNFNYAEYFPRSKHAKVTHAGSVGEQLDHYLKQAELTRSTEATYRRYIDNFWKPKIGHIALRTLKHSDITLALKAKDASGKTRNNCLSALNQALELAVFDGVITKNPAQKIERAKSPKKKVDPFSQKEMENIILYMRTHFPEAVWNFFECWFMTGLRTSEIIGLEWAYVDLENRTIRVTKGFVVDEMEEGTKTKMERTVNLSQRAYEALLRQQALTYHSNDRVFIDPGTGKPWAYEQNARKRYWIPALNKLEIRYRRPYTCRHTCATIGLMAGALPAYMAKQLGHGLKVFFEDYADWINGKDNDREMAKIEEKLANYPRPIPEMNQAPVGA